MPYSRHQPELTVLHQVVRQHLAGFLRTLKEEAGAVPAFITRAWRSYLLCGLGGAGFARLRCESCLHDHIVCFSCKTRQLCPSCAGRAMADGASHLVDRVFPDVNVRQYVLAFPFELWGMLAYQPALVNAAQKIFCDAIQKWHQQRAKEYALPDGKTGGVAVLHRFGSGLNVMPHVHALLLDGVYTPDAVFHRFAPPDATHLEELCRSISVRVLAMLKRRGALKEEEKQDALAACTQLALFSGERVGGDEEDAPRPTSAKSANKLCAVVDGFNLEATTTVKQGDREALERTCRYLLRGPLALDRLKFDEETETIRYALKRPGRRGKTHLVMTPAELFARMTALIPSPRLCLRRTFGVLASGSSLRKRVVPKSTPRNHSHTLHPPDQKPGESPPTRTPWAELIARCFDGADALKCTHCGKRMAVLAIIRDRKEAQRFLEGRADDAEPPAQGRIRGPP